ncbi:MAG: hypothetical protein QOE53_961 [Pseudonocardiales bacterium]|nr:hypothetical protein [Pseudonocardiales bacterium]
MSRLLRPATAGIAFLLLCGILGSANPAFADKSAKVSPADKSASVIVTVDDKVAVISPDEKVALTPDEKVALTPDEKVAAVTGTDDKVA